MQKSSQIFSKATCFYDFENLLLADSTDSLNVQLYNITCFRTVKSEAPFLQYIFSHWKFTNCTRPHIHCTNSLNLYQDIQLNTYMILKCEIDEI